MYYWFRRLINKRHPQDQYIFAYHDGFRKRYADPAYIEDVLVEHLGEDWKDKVVELYSNKPIGLMGVAEDEYKEKKRKLKNELLTAIDIAFDLEPLDDSYRKYFFFYKKTGLLQFARLGLLTAYMQFCINYIKLSRPFVDAPKRDSPTGENLPTQNGSDSTSQPEKLDEKDKQQE